VPPLRSRVDDIPLLARFFVQSHAAHMGCDHLEIAPDAQAALCRYTWPGNVRELGNVMERALALSSGDRITLTDLPRNIQEFTPETAPAPAALPPEGMDLESTMAEFEKSLIIQALDQGRFSQKKAAQLLGLTPRSLRYRLQKYGLEAH